MYGYQNQVDFFGVVFCWWGVSPEQTDTTTVRDKHTIQVVNILSLSIQCPINEHYRGYL